VSGKEFFIERYEKLGWKYREVKLRQSIRLNSTNTKNTKLVERLRLLGVNIANIPFLKSGYWVQKSSVSVGATAEYLLGLYSIQEAAAQISATLFTNIQNKVVLDASAAPGGKTVQLADIMKNTGAIIALDVNKRRLTALSNHLERCRVNNTIVYLLDARQVSSLGKKFDRILVDAPCSGNFASDKDWFRNRKIEDVQRNSLLQRQILTKVAECLTEDGELVYSTCSIEPEEDELNIDWAIKNLNLQVEYVECYGEKGLSEIFGEKLDASIERCKRIWPGVTQGFFVCKLKKRGRQR
jgi:NOL1/NOP2/sun family putative RNA methylase